VQDHVVELRRCRAEHLDQLLGDLDRPSAQAERIGGGIRQEVDDTAARLQIGRMVEVGPDLMLPLAS
jgi:hypothetical protein